MEIKRGENNLRRVQSHSGPTQYRFSYLFFTKEADQDCLL